MAKTKNELISEEKDGETWWKLKKKNKEKYGFELRWLRGNVKRKGDDICDHKVTEK